jgi:hypothetical protein
MAVDRILAKQDNYKEAIVKNHTVAKNICEELLAVDGEIAKTMSTFKEESLQRELEESIKEQRERFKKLAERNVENHRNVNAFVGALQQVKTHVQQQSNHNTSDTLDYEKLIQTKIQEYKAAQQDSQLQVHQEPYYRDIIKALGEQPTSLNDDDEEELQVLRNPSSNAQSFNCPIMATLMQDPVKSKVCGHSYSRQGILQHLRAGRGGVNSCPVAGCQNRSLDKHQLETDAETAMKIRRHVRRQDNIRQMQQTQDLLDDSDEE